MSSPQKKKILLVAPLACYPSYQGNSARIASVYEYLVNAGHDVYYLHLPDSAFDPKPMADRLGAKYICQKFYFNAIAIWLLFRSVTAFVFGQSSRHVKIDDFITRGNISFYKKTIKTLQPDVVWVSHVYLSKLFNYTPAGIIKVLDTIDSVYLRFKSIFENRPGYRSISVSLTDEINCINRADHVVCIQDNETAFFRANGCTKPVSTLGHLVSFTPTGVSQHKNNLLYLATSYFVYTDAITLFLKEVWPQLIAMRPGTHLYIAGKVCNTLNNETLPANVTLLGVVPNLKKLYAETDVSINPVKQGSGLKIKTIESLAFGKPVVTTLAGKDGLDSFENKGVIVATDTPDWVTKVTALLDNADHYDKQILNLSDNIARYNEANIAIFEKLFHH